MTTPVKVLVFAHVPPPLHGQSVMVQALLEGLRGGGHGRFEVHHVDARFSQHQQDIGSVGLRKFTAAIRFCRQAIAARLRHGVRILYYIPAPPKRSAILRDWIVMALCRPFFPAVVLHWHAAGLGRWIHEQSRGGWRARMAARTTRVLLGRTRLSIALSQWGAADVRALDPVETVVIGNGIADPCPGAETELLPRREHRRRELARSLEAGGPRSEFRVCFLGSCTGEKGLWDTLTAVALANAELVRRGAPLTTPLTMVLRVAGEFPRPSDQARFERLLAELTIEHALAPGWCEHVGLVVGPRKRQFLEEADCLCFPTHYKAESFGLVAVEALAFGIPVIASDWRMLPELMALARLPTVPVGDPRALAQALVAAVGRDDPMRLRQVFLDHFTIREHLRHVAEALANLSDTEPSDRKAARSDPPSTL